MSPSARDSWLGIAAEVGSIAAPAGLNFVTSGTTTWLYALDADWLVHRASPWSLRPTGLRIPFEAGALRRELPRLTSLDMLWRERLRRAGPRLPRWRGPRFLRARLEAMAQRLEAPLLCDFALRSVALLEAMRLVPEYHPPEGRGPGYLFDLLENGLTLLRVERAGVLTSPTLTRPVG